MDEQERLRVDNTNTGDPEVNVQAGQTRDINVQNAHASGNAGVFQSGRDQYIEAHLYFGVGVHRTRRVEADAGVEVDPYPRGMAALRPEDAEWFFGRDELLADVIRRVDERFLEGGGPLMVMAPSGAGKSSLLHAGLIPKLEQGAIPGSQHWPGLRITPTAAPIKALAEAITVITGQLAADVERELVERPDRCVEALGSVVRSRSSTVITANARLMVIVDQLEELFTLCTDDAERRRFLDVLSRLCAPGAAGREPVALLVFGMRADFYAHCADYPELRECVQHGHVVVGPMNTKELREAILNPAQRAGLRVESGLVELLLGDLGALGTEDGKDARPGRYEAGRLPLLAHALRATYLGRHGRTLTVEAYRNTGGIEKAVAKTADDTFRQLDPAAREAARALFLRLIKIGDGTEHTRRRVPRTELLGDNADQAVTAALDAFTSKRLLTQGLDHDTVEITHEALIHAWPRLRDWINDDRAGNLTRQQLTDAATAWENEGHDRAALYRGARLATAREHTSTPPHNANLTPTTRHFLRASTHNENRAARRRNMVIAALSLLTVLSLVAAYTANTQRNVAIANQLTAQADRVLEGNPAGPDVSLAAQVNLAAYRWDSGNEEIKSKLYSAASGPLATLLRGPTGFIHDVEFSPDRRTVAVVSTIGNGDLGRAGMRLWTVSESGDYRPLGKMIEGSFSSVSFGLDGRMLAASSDEGIGLWRVGAAGAEPVDDGVPPESGSGSPVSFSPDGRMLVAGGVDGIRLWRVDIEGAEPVNVNAALGSESASSVSFSSDSRTLATSGSGGIWLWRVGPTSVEPIGGGPALGGADSVSLRPDGRVMATMADDGIRLWSLESDGVQSLGDPLVERSRGTVENPMSFSPDGRTLATVGADGVRLWNVANPGDPRSMGEPLTGQSRASAVKFGPDGRTLAVTDGASVRMWDIPPAMLNSAHKVTSVEFDPSGRVLATVEKEYMKPGETEPSSTLEERVTLWDVANPESPVRIGDALTGSAVAFSPQGEMMATSEFGLIQLWDVSDPARIRPVGSHFDGGVSLLEFSPDGRTLAAAGRSPKSLMAGVRLWDVADPGDAEKLGEGAPAHPTDIESLAFSPDGRVLAAAGESSTLLWNTERLDGSEDKSVFTSRSEGIYSVGFSPDGILAAGSSGALALWDVAGLQDVDSIGEKSAEYRNAASSLAFGSHGRVLATAGNGGVQLWDVSGSGEVTPRGQNLTGHGDEVSAVDVSPDARDHMLVSASPDGTVRIQDLDVDRAAERICRTAKGYFEPDVLGRYFPGGITAESPC